MPDLIKQGEIIIDRAERTFGASVISIEDDVYLELLKIFDTLTITDGKLSTNQKTEEFLLSLDRRILAVLKKTGYNDAVYQYATNFDLLAKNAIDLQYQFNKINITQSQINPYKRIEVQNMLMRLLGGGINANFITPLREALYRNILFGGSLGEVENTLRTFVISEKDNDSKLARYVGQVSRDGLSQFDGGIQDRIKDELKLDAIRYVGSLIVDSRAQCIKWVEQGLIKLDFAFEKDIEAAVDRRLFYAGKRASGMYPETNLSNICSNRGGYRCRHRAIATKWKTDKKSKK